MKRQNTNWEKIFINFISISRVYKDQLQINNRKRKTSVKNSQDFNRLLEKIYEWQISTCKSLTDFSLQGHAI